MKDQTNFLETNLISCIIACGFSPVQSYQSIDSSKAYSKVIERNKIEPQIKALAKEYAL